MPLPTESDHEEINLNTLREELRTHHSANGVDRELPGWLFVDKVVYIDNLHPPNGEANNLDMAFHLISNILLFAGAKVVDTMTDEAITHIVVITANNDNQRNNTEERGRIKDIREKLQW